jgi:hypothetical protein
MHLPIPSNPPPHHNQPVDPYGDIAPSDIILGSMLTVYAAIGTFVILSNIFLEKFPSRPAKSRLKRKFSQWHISATSLLCNVFVMTVILSQRFLKPGNGSVLWHATLSLLMCDSLLLLCIVGYVAPACTVQVDERRRFLLNQFPCYSSLLQQYLLPSSCNTSDLSPACTALLYTPGLLMHWMWYENCAMLNIIALNR